MGKLININKYVHCDSKKSAREKIIADEARGQIIMFTGIRYERQVDTDKGDNRPNKKRKRG